MSLLKTITLPMGISGVTADAAGRIYATAGSTVYKLDAAGNAKAVDAIKNRADRSTGNPQSAGPVNAKVTGSMEGSDSIKVDRIDVQ
jgi:hypothetical protein